MVCVDKWFIENHQNEQLLQKNYIHFIIIRISIHLRLSFFFKPYSISSNIETISHSCTLSIPGNALMKLAIIMDEMGKNWGGELWKGDQGNRVINLGKGLGNGRK